MAARSIVRTSASRTTGSLSALLPSPNSVPSCSRAPALMVIAWNRLPLAWLTVIVSTLLERVRLGRGEVGDEVDLAGLERLDLGVAVLDVAEDQLVELRGAPPELLVGHQRDRVVHVVCAEDPRAVADDRELLVVVELRVVADTLPLVLRQDRAAEREHGRLRGLELDDERARVGGADALEVLDEVAVGGGRGLVLHHRVEGPPGILGRDRLPVGPRRVTDLVDPRQPIRRGLPRLGQRRDDVAGRRVVVGQVVIHQRAQRRADPPHRQERAQRVHLLADRDGQRVLLRLRIRPRTDAAHQRDHQCHGRGHQSGLAPDGTGAWSWYPTSAPPPTNVPTPDGTRPPAPIVHGSTAIRPSWSTTSCA